eukprot:3366079-Pyramimonas_sp.AAC.1
MRSGMVWHSGSIGGLARRAAITGARSEIRRCSKVSERPRTSEARWMLVRIHPGQDAKRRSMAEV